MKKLIVAGLLAGTYMFWPVSADAAPVTCPGAQVVVHDGGDSWSCVNPAGNKNESDKDKNTNHPH